MSTPILEYCENIDYAKKERVGEAQLASGCTPEAAKKAADAAEVVEVPSL